MLMSDFGPRPMPEANDIPGWKAVIDWFGYTPNFHDAEVVSVDLRRAPEPSQVRLHAWRTNSDVTEAGHYRQDRHALVTFTILGITSLKLEGWNHQNVLSRFWGDRTDDGYVLHLPDIFCRIYTAWAGRLAQAASASRSRLLSRDEEWRAASSRWRRAQVPSGLWRAES